MALNGYFTFLKVRELDPYYQMHFSVTLIGRWGSYSAALADRVEYNFLIDLHSYTIVYIVRRALPTVQNLSIRFL